MKLDLTLVVYEKAELSIRLTPREFDGPPVELEYEPSDDHEAACERAPSGEYQPADTAACDEGDRRFETGDVVVLTRGGLEAAGTSSGLDGRLGAVATLSNDGSYGVIFPGWTRGHDLDGFLKPGAEDGWWVEASDIRLVDTGDVAANAAASIAAEN